MKDGVSEVCHLDCREWFLPVSQLSSTPKAIRGVVEVPRELRNEVMGPQRGEQAVSWSGWRARRPGTKWGHRRNRALDDDASIASQQVEPEQHPEVPNAIQPPPHPEGQGGGSVGTVNCGGNETPFDNGWHTQTAERTGHDPRRVASMQDVDGEPIPIIKLAPDSRARWRLSRESRGSNWMKGDSGKKQTSRTPTGFIYGTQWPRFVEDSAPTRTNKTTGERMCFSSRLWRHPQRPQALLRLRRHEA